MAAALALSTHPGTSVSDETYQRSFRFPASLIDEIAALQGHIEEEIESFKHQRVSMTATVIWALNETIQRVRKADPSFDARVAAAKRERLDEG